MKRYEWHGHEIQVSCQIVGQPLPSLFALRRGFVVTTGGRHFYPDPAKGLPMRTRFEIRDGAEVHQGEVLSAHPTFLLPRMSYQLIIDGEVIAADAQWLNL